MHIGIAGGGLLGHLAAWRLTAIGHRVEVFEANSTAEAAVPGARAAAWTSAGMLSPLAERESGGEEVYRLGLRSMKLWGAVEASADIQAAGGLGLVQTGSLMLFQGTERGSADRILRLIDTPESGPQRLSLGQPAQLEPSLNPRLLGALLPGEGHLEPTRALTSLRRAAEATDLLRWHSGAIVHKVRPSQIELSDASRRQFDEVIDVRGLGMKGQASGPLSQVRGVRGETLLLQAEPGSVPSRAVRLLHPRWRVYLVPRPQDRLLVGATEIESEDRGGISVESVLDLLAAARHACPGLAEARLLQTDTNLRPALPDNLPQVETQSGLIRINGLFRHGWLLAPALLEQALQDALELAPPSSPSPSSRAYADSCESDA